MSTQRKVQTIFTVNSDEHNSKLKEIRREYELTAEKIKTVDTQLGVYGRTSDNLTQKLTGLESQMKNNRDFQDRYTKSMSDASAKSKEYEDAIKRISVEKGELKDRIKMETEAFGENSAVVKGSKEELRLLEQEHSDYNEALRRSEGSVQKYAKQVEITRQNQMKLEADIAKTRLELERQSSGLYQAGLKAQEYGKKLQDAGKKMSNIGDKVNRNVSLPVFGAGVAAVKMASDFESAFVGVMKTVDEADVPGGYDAIKASIREVAKVLPATHEEIAGVVEVAGQLGIEGESLMSFSKVMIDLGETTDIEAAKAGESLARFANITSMSQKDFDKLGSTIVDLGNNFAASESEIVNMGSRLAAAGYQIGLTEPQIMGMAAGLTSLGLEAEAGGSAFSKLMVRLKNAVSTGNADLGKFAEVAGMSAADFKTAFERDAAGGLLAFIEGIARTNEVSGGALMTLENLGIKEIRMRDATLRAAGGFEVLSDALGTADQAWIDNTALVTEAELRYQSSESQIKISLNRIKDVAIDVGAKLLPHVVNVAEGVADVVEGFTNLNPQTQDFLIKMAGIAAVSGPALKTVGGITSGVGKLSEGIGKLMVKSTGLDKGIAVTKGALGLGLTPAVGIATAAVGLLAGAVWLSTEKFRIHDKHIENAINGIDGFSDSVESATPIISDFNRANSVFDDAIEEKKEKIAKLEPLITEIFKEGVHTRKALTEDEMATIRQYNELIDATNVNIRNKYTNRLDIAREKLSEELDLTEEGAAQHIATANKYDKELTEITEQTYEDKLLIVQEGVRVEQDLRSKGRTAEAEAQRKHNDDLRVEAKAAREKELEEANKATLDYLNEILNKYKESSAAELSGMEGLSEIRAREVEINRWYTEERNKIENDGLRSERAIQRDLERLRNEKVVRLNELKTEENWIWDENTEAVAGALLNQVTTIMARGGEIDRETANMVNGILSSLGRTPEGAEKVEEMLDRSLDALVAANPELTNEVSLISRNISDVMDGIADGTYETGEDIMWALLNGIRSKEPEVELTMGDFKTIVEEGMDGMETAVEEAATTMMDPFEKVGMDFAEFGQQFGMTEEEVAQSLGKLSEKFHLTEQEIMMIVNNTGGTLEEFAQMHDDNLSRIEESITNYVKITTNGFSEIEQNSTVGLKTYMKNMEKNQKATADWAKNTQALMKAGVSEGIIQELAKMGPAGAEQAERWVKQLEEMNGGALTNFDGLNNKTKTFLDDFNGVYTQGLVEANEAAKVQHEANDYGGQGMFMIGQFIAGMIAELPYMKEMAEEMGYSAGVYTKYGIVESEPEAKTAARYLADGVINELGEYPHEAQIIGGESAKKTAQGIKDNTPEAKREALLMADGVINALGEYPHEAESIAGSSVQKMAAAINSNSPAARREAYLMSLGLLDEFDKLPPDARKIASKAVQETATGIKNNGYKAKDETAALKRKMVNQLSPLERNGASGGKNFADGVADGIYDGTYLAERAARWLARKTQSAFERRLEIYSPSRVMRKSARNIPSAVALGIEDDTRLVERAMDELALVTMGDGIPGGRAFEATSKNINEFHQTVDVNINVSGSKSLENDPDFMNKVKTVILHDIQSGNRTIPNRTSLIPI